MSDEDRVSMVSSPKTKTETKTRGFQDQDRDQDSRVPRPRPRPRLWGSKAKTETETRGFQDQDQDQDSEVPRPRPRPRLVKTGLETSRDQDSSLENSKSATMYTVAKPWRSLWVSIPVYLGVTLDRTLSYREHLTCTAAKLKRHNNPITKLAGTSWGACASTHRTSALFATQSQNTAAQCG